MVVSVDGTLVVGKKEHDILQAGQLQNLRGAVDCVPRSVFNVVASLEKDHKRSWTIYR